MMRLLLLLILLCAQCDAANWYVRPNGTTYGTSAGTSWTNAWTGLGNIAWASLTAGDTVWVAGGTYSTTLNPAKTGTNGNPITIARARADASACTSAGGWSAGFDATVVQTDSIDFSGNYDYLVISGRTVATPAADSLTSPAANKGWKMDFSAKTAGNMIGFNDGGDNITLEYIEILGAGTVTISNDMRGIDMTPASADGITNVLISHVYIHKTESGMYVTNSNAITVEFCIMEEIACLNTPAFHPNGIYTSSSPNCIVRNSVFRKVNSIACGEGIFFEQSGGSTGWKIEGCMFLDIDYSGVKAVEVTSAVGALKIYNCTYINCNAAISQSDSPSASGAAEQANNLYYNTATSSLTGMSSSNQVEASTTAVFSNYAGRDGLIVATVTTNYPRNAGKVLTLTSNTDFYGVTRAADGTWDAGFADYAAASGATVNASAINAAVTIQ